MYEFPLAYSDFTIAHFKVLGPNNLEIEYQKMLVRLGHLGKFILPAQKSLAATSNKQERDAE